MKTPSTKLNRGGPGSLFNWRWTAILAVLACLMVGRATAGTLTGSSILIISTNPVNLSAEGDLDWGQWGTFATGNFNHKAGVVSQISDITMLGGTLNSFAGAAANAFWFDGTMDKIVQGRATGAYVNGPPNNGFQLVIPASATTKVLNLYIGVFNVLGELDLALSDGTTLTLTNNGNRRFTITFADSTPSATLTVKYYNLTAGGNVTLMAASLATATSLPLSVAAPTLSCPSTVNAGSTFDLLANPLGVTAAGLTAFGYQWQVDGVDIPGATTNPYNGATAGSVSVHNYRVVVTNSILGGAAVTSPSVALTVTAPTGTLGASGVDIPKVNPTPLDVNLTTEGVIDWAHWGTTGPGVYDTKANIIGDFTQIGADSQVEFDSTITYTWTDASTANTAETAWNIGLGVPVTNGFVLNIPASSASNRLAYIYVGINTGASLHFEASMSDGSSPLFTDDSTTVGTRRYSIAYQAATPGSTLTVTITEPQRNAGGGAQRISLQSVSLQPVPPLSVTPLVVSPSTTVCAGYPMTVSIPPFQPVGAPPFSYQWQRNTGTGYTNFGANASSVSYNAGSVGSESCQVIITGSQGTITSTPVTLTVTPVSGLLRFLSRDSIGIVNLTTEGSLDWSKWGIGNTVPGFDQKATGGSKIGNYTVVGDASIFPFGGAAGSYRWTDGTAYAGSNTNNNGIYHNSFGNGFQLTVEAATTNRVLHVYLGSFQSVAHVQGYLNDYSALPFTDDSLPNGQAARYNIELAAGSPGQTMTFQFWDNSSGGNVTLMAATLEGVPALDAGVATIGPTNIVAAGSTIQLLDLTANGLAPLKFQWQADTGGGFANLSGATNATVTLNAGAAGSKNYQVVVSDLTGSLTSAPVALTVTVATSTLAANYTPLDVPGAPNDLTAEGTIDWAQWGNGGVSGYEVKDTLTNQISQYSFIGLGPVNSYGGNGIHVVWSDGTPDLTGDTATGLYIAGSPNGFQLTAEATSSDRLLNIYCAVYAATMHMTATMSDNSAPIFVDESFSAPFAGGVRYSFRYSDPAPGQHLIVTWWDASGGGNVTINAATLQPYVAPGGLQVQKVGGGQLQIVWPAGTLLESTNVTGPWTTNLATSPYTFTPTGKQKFFRTQIP